MATSGIFNPRQLFRAGASGAGSYAFTTFTFTNGGIDSYAGATLTQFKSAYSSTSWTQDSNYFNVVNGAQFWKVPATGSYTVELAGAGGGSNYVGNAGGSGVIIKGTVSLTAGNILRIIVGTRGGKYQYTGGGGGASSVVVVSTMSTTNASGLTPLMIAGAGGGGGNSGGTGYNATYTNAGTSGYSGNVAGTGGNGGAPAVGSSSGGWGTGGAGWISSGGGNGGTAHNQYDQQDPPLRQDGGSASFNGATASHGTGYSSSLHDYSSSGSCIGAPGGFGGGGGGACNGAGAGAGYNGGGAGGGGGGSYFNAIVTSQTNVGYNPADTNGYVKITKV